MDIGPRAPTLRLSQYAPHHGRRENVVVGRELEPIIRWRRLSQRNRDAEPSTSSASHVSKKRVGGWSERQHATQRYSGTKLWPTRSYFFDTRNRSWVLWPTRIVSKLISRTRAWVTKQVAFRYSSGHATHSVGSVPAWIRKRARFLGRSTRHAHCLRASANVFVAVGKNPGKAIANSECTNSTSLGLEAARVCLVLTSWYQHPR